MYIYSEFKFDIVCRNICNICNVHILHTYIHYIQAGEDQGRLASMAKEFGLAKGRRQKQQIRKKHTFKVRFVLKLYFVFLMLY